MLFVKYSSREDYEAKKKIEDRLPVKILRFGQKRLYGIELNELLLNMDNGKEALKKVELIMHHNQTINTNIMSERDVYEITILPALEMIVAYPSERNNKIGDYLVNYLDNEMEEMDKNKNGMAHKNPNALNYIKNTYDYKNLDSKIIIYKKRIKNSDIFLIKADNLFEVIYPSDYEKILVNKAIQKLQKDYFKDVDYITTGLFSKEIYLTISTAIRICNQNLFGYDTEDDSNIDYKIELTNTEIINYNSIKEYLKIKLDELIDNQYKRMLGR